MTPWTVDLVADRWTPFADSFQFPAGVDLTGATLRAQVRGYRDAPGAPLVDLSNAALGMQGLSVTTTVDNETSIATSTVGMAINEVAIESLVKTNPTGGDLCLVWDLHISLAGFDKRRWIAGAFTIRAGATQ
ncbi:MAG: hypothetical protein P0Y64_16870 [Candidatus Sphingomonas colombiensis]|nr:hypothetical protein [Sphingomonas sp.]WEK42993.1 MAG: hypothetical protein P0Y64_16870 [Sphingomonas sp.]